LCWRYLFVKAVHSSFLVHYLSDVIYSSSSDCPCACLLKIGGVLSS
jgi:hypothetical protein